MSRFDHEWRVEELERSLLETRTEAAGLFSQVQTMQEQIEQIEQLQAALKVQLTNDFEIRGELAAALTCWHRLTGEEAAEIVTFVAALRS